MYILTSCAPPDFFHFTSWTNSYNSSIQMWWSKELRLPVCRLRARTIDLWFTIERVQGLLIIRAQILLRTWRHYQLWAASSMAKANRWLKHKFYNTWIRKFNFQGFRKSLKLSAEIVLQVPMIVDLQLYIFRPTRACSDAVRRICASKTVSQLHVIL